MHKRKLRGFVLPSIYIMTILVVMLGIGFFANKVNDDYSNYSFSTRTMKDNSIPVISTEGKNSIIKPYNDEKVGISKSFYDITSDEQTQQKSLIFYQNTYMENTGVLYTSDEPFDVVSVLDGKIVDIKTDDILGNVVTVEHDKNLVTVYYSLGNIDVKKDSTIKQGQSIGKSGSNKLENEKENCLLFEVYYKGNLLNPESFYNMNTEEL